MLPCADFLCAVCATTELSAQLNGLKLHAPMVQQQARQQVQQVIEQRNITLSPIHSVGHIVSRSQSPADWTNNNREALLNGWVHVQTPGGRPFYFNLLTKGASWDKPPSCDSIWSPAVFGALSQTRVG